MPATTLLPGALAAIELPHLPGITLGDAGPRGADGSVFDFLAQLERARFCSHPIRLAGQVHTVDTTTGEMRPVLDTADRPDGVLLLPCGNRRASRCPSCSWLYAGDAWQIVHAGMAGGCAHVPATVGQHPALFATVTAPSFGPVHTRGAKPGLPARGCRPRTGRCPHGRPAGCWAKHDLDDPRLGEPICLDCYDHTGQVIWNATCSRLWKRTVDLTYRRAAHLAGMSETAFRRQVRIAYLKVAEMQARGAVHFHAVLRLDAATDDPDSWEPPPAWATGRLLAAALRWAILRADWPCPGPAWLVSAEEARGPESVTEPGPQRRDERDRDRKHDRVGDLARDGEVEQTDDDSERHPHDEPDEQKSPSHPTELARWGTQSDVRPITVDGGELTLDGTAVGAYLAKYVTKSVTAAGTLDQRIRTEEELAERLPYLREHHRRLVRTAWRLGFHRVYAGAGLRRWAHTFGFGGHWVTKSRRYSTTFGERRQIRRTWAQHHRPDQERVPLDAEHQSDQDEPVTVATWRFHGVGFRTPGDRWLALQAADHARQQREDARVARRDARETPAA